MQTCISTYIFAQGNVLMKYKEKKSIAPLGVKGKEYK